MNDSRQRPSSSTWGWRTGWLLCLVGMAWPAAGAGAEPTVEVSPFPEEARRLALEKVAVALRLELEEQLPAAELAFREALHTDEWAAPVQQAAGDHYLHRGQLELAAVAYGALTRIDPYGSGGYAQLGLVQVLLGQDEGIEQLRKALEMDPLAASTRLPLAKLALAAGDLVRTAQLLEAIPTEERGRPEVALALAELRRQQGQEAELLKIIEELEKAHPQGELGLRIAEWWLGRGRCAEALPRLRQEAARSPRAEAFRALGWGLLLCGRPPIRAAGAFHAALRQDAADDGARVGLAWALLALPGQPEAAEQAQAWLAEVLRRDPAHGGALLAQAELHRRRNELPQAEARLTLPANHPVADEARVLRARLALQREDPYAAVALLRQLAETRPDLRHARLNLIAALLRAGRSTEARELLRTFGRELPEPLRLHGEAILSSPRSR